MVTVNERLLWTVVLLTIFVNFVNGFNFDVKYPVIASGESNSYFGYSLAVHETSSTSKLLLVGAPKEQFDTIGSSGALHKCQKSGTILQCNRINGFTTDEKGGNQWLGATVISRSGTAMVCAPRTGDLVTGQCFYGEGTLSSFSLYYPTSEHYCESGFSAAFSLDGNRFYSGGPSCTKNQGRLFTSTKPDVNKTTQYMGDISYLAYSMASGKVLNQKEGLVISVGFHHDSNFTGKVLILDPTVNIEDMKRDGLSGYQSGEHFGASLAVIDLNKDGREDIIVGAPHHTDYKNSEIKFDIGAVYIYYQKSDGKYERSRQKEPDLKGQTTGAQFGYALAGLGDADGDGFNDLAVGAPYENDGYGTVYIYNGKMLSSQSPQPSQIISGKNFNPSIRTFGFSFNNIASDFDDNKYPDLIVGAYQDAKVVLLPARPVVRLTNQITFDPKSISLEKKECPKQYGGSTIKVPCAKMRYCLSYNGVNVPAKLDVNINITLDASQPKIHRLLFLESNRYNLQETIALDFGKQLCKEKDVYVQSVSSTSSSQGMLVTLTATISDVARALSPALDVYKPGNGNVSETLIVRRECGSDNVCTPDLQLNINTSSNSFVQGSNEYLTMDVVIYNVGAEEAYGVQFFLNLSNALKYNRTDRDHTDPSVSCSPSDVNGPYLICDIGNSLLSKKSAKLRITLQPTPTNEKFISLTAETNSSIDKENGTLSDNTKIINLTFTADAKLQLSSWAQPETLSYNLTAVEINEKNATPQYTQFFEAHNLGPSNIISGRFQIFFPTHTEEGYAINQMTATPKTGQANCTFIPTNTIDLITTGSQKTVNGINIDCEMGKVASKGRVVISVFAQLSPEALIKKPNADGFNLTSKLSGRITSLPFDQDVSGIPIVKSEAVLKVVKIKKDPVALQAIPIWIPIVVAIAALIIVAIVAFILKKCGFFKRNRPGAMTADMTTIPEAQPLQDMGQSSTR